MQQVAPITKTGSLSTRETYAPIVIMAMLFFVFGFITWLNAVLIPYFKIACELTNFQSYLVAFSFYISYFLIPVPSSYLLKHLGFKKRMSVSFWIMAAGAFIFIPAAITKTYGLFLLGLFLLGTGLAVLQTAANSYVTILGPRERAAQRMSIMGICNKTAGILAPLVLGAVVFQSTDEAVIARLPLMNEMERNIVLSEMLQRVIVPYTCIGATLIGLGLMIRYSTLPEIDTDSENPDLRSENSEKKTIFQFPQLILGAVAIFLHVGTHVVAIDTVIGYAVSMNMPLSEAKVFPSYTLFATLLGYLLGIAAIPKFISQENMLRVCTLLGLAFTFLILFSRGEVSYFGHIADISLWFVVLLGFSNSMIYAGIWPLALDRLGRYTRIGSSVMIMGLCGQAILPLFYVRYADAYGLRFGYWVLLPCFLYLVFYAFYGYRIRNWSLVQKRRKPQANEMKGIRGAYK